MSDLWTRNESGGPMAVYGLSSTLGPPLALVMSGYLYWLQPRLALDILRTNGNNRHFLGPASLYHDEAVLTNQGFSKSYVSLRSKRQI